MRALRLVAVPAFAVAFLVLAGCGDKAQQVLTELRAESGRAEDPFSTDVVARGAAELERTLGGPVQALSVEVSPQRILFSVQDPKKPANVDAYELRNGVLLAPQPVQLMGDGDLAANLFPLAGVPLARLSELVTTAAARSEIEGARIQSVTIRRKFSGIPTDMRDQLARARRQAGMPEETPDPEQLPDGAIAVEMYLDSPRRRGYVLANGEDFAVVRVRLL
jgi:hypothetical protein